MSATKEFDVEIWKRNLRAPPGAPRPDDDACTRWFNNFFVFWLVCETKTCKRTSRCTGDAAACRDRFMPLVPQRMKFELQVTLKAINDRLPLEAVKQRVDEELARFDETTRTLERLGYATSASSPLPAKGHSRPPSTDCAREEKANARRGPRVRFL